LSAVGARIELRKFRKKGAKMPKYEVKMLVEFSGELEADSPEEAEKLAWTSWGDTMDKEITYDNVDSIEVKEIEDYEEDEDEEELF